MEVLVHLKKFDKLFNKKLNGNYSFVGFLVYSILNVLFICRNFTLEILGRIKTVYPTMYGFQQEKIQLPTLSPVKLNYELTITPSM